MRQDDGKTGGIQGGRQGNYPHAHPPAHPRNSVRMKMRMRMRMKSRELIGLANSFFSVQRRGSLKAAENFRLQCSQMSGNPVRIRDGCATVRATTPNATAHGREGGKKA